MMFNRTRKRIVASSILFLVLFLIVTLSVIYTSSYLNIKRQNIEMLSRYADIFSLERQPGDELPPISALNVDGLKNDDPYMDLLTFYSAAISDEGEVLAVDTAKNHFYTENDIIDLANEILSRDKASGRMNDLLYVVKQKDGYRLAAFMDITVTVSSIHTLMKYTLLSGGAAIVLIFFLSVLTADKIVSPLEKNDIRQKQFVSDAGHELKTPISVISANAELLEKELGDSEWLSNIRYETERMSTLVTQLLDLSRAENAKLHTEDIDLSDLVIGETLPFESVAFENGLTIESDISENITVEGNRTQLSQLVSILTDNAVRHSEGGRTIEILLKQERKQAVLSVTNSAAPIPQEKQEHLFDRFYRIDDVRNSNDGHYGLGLAIAKAISDAHNGSIIVSCADNKVTFIFSLPVKKI